MQSIAVSGCTTTKIQMIVDDALVQAAIDLTLSHYKITPTEDGWAGDVQVAVPHDQYPTRWQSKPLRQVQPHYWAKPFTNF